MSERFIDLQSRPCPAPPSIIRPVEIDADNDLGRALIESYSRYSLGEGEGLCCLPDSSGACRWFVHRTEAGGALGSAEEDRYDPPSSKAAIEGAVVLASLCEEKAGKSRWAGALETGAIVTAFSLFAAYMLKFIMDAGYSSMVAPERLAAAEGEAPAPEDRPTSFEAGTAQYGVDLTLLSESEWYRDLGQTDRKIVNMVLEQDVADALKSRGFVERFVTEGRLTEAGLRYLIDSRDGNLLGTTDMRLGPVSLRRERPDAIEKSRFDGRENPRLEMRRHAK